MSYSKPNIFFLGSYTSLIKTHFPFPFFEEFYISSIEAPEPMPIPWTLEYLILADIIATISSTLSTSPSVSK